MTDARVGAGKIEDELGAFHSTKKAVFNKQIDEDMSKGHRCQPKGAPKG